MEAKYNNLKELLAEVNDLENVLKLLSWDQNTYMPPRGAEARARQMATLAMIYQQKSADPAIGRLLDDLQQYAESLPYDSDEASLIRVARQDYERAIRVPPEFMAEMTAQKALSFQVWTEARSENNYKKIQPYLQKMLDLSRKQADFFPGYEHIADPLIDYEDHGMKASMIRTLFSELRSTLVPLERKVTSQPPADDACLRQHFPASRQLQVSQEIVRQLGYDFSRGRQDLTYHPFMTKFSLADVRITTRVKEDFLSECLFSSIHEAGHAMYEQGIRMDLEALPLANGVSAGVHESQSRLWENVVGRSLPFWEFFYPQLKTTFPDQLGHVSLEAYYRAINKVAPSLIRTDADELTYDLHIMIRFDLELALLEGKLEVRDLPEAWRARYQEDLGITPPDDRDGVLQDVHWFSGTVGGSFQGYTLGNIMHAQFYQAALIANPSIPGEMRQGNFRPLHSWLVENIYQHGRKFTAQELVQRATGRPLSIAPYIQYLDKKYGELFF